MRKWQTILVKPLIEGRLEQGKDGERELRKRKQRNKGRARKRKRTNQ